MRKRGFTLIELLVVISIISLLSSIVLASLNTARVKARTARRLIDAKQIQNALELYASDHNGAYPIMGSSWDVSGCNTTNWATLGATLQNYIPQLPHDPAENCSIARQYYYRSDDGINYKILIHVPEDPFNPPSSSLIDQARDGGPTGNGTPGSCVGAGDGTNIWAWTIMNSSALQCQ